ncbi:MAG: OmpP1/FadL family transporter [Candidatus Aminicenantes bacterium]
MKKSAVFTLSFILWLLLSAFPQPAAAQLILGQYEDEAPLGTWNILGVNDATSVALGSARFAWASDCSVSLSNPALLSRLPETNFSILSSYLSSSLFKYSIVNTGVILTEKNIFIRSYAVDFAGLSVRWSGWTLSLGLALTEIYSRPAVKHSYRQSGSLLYTLNFNQDGLLRTVNFSAARKIGRRVSVGLGFNYIYGTFEKTLEEKWTTPDITITDLKSHDFHGYYLNGGVLVDLSDKLAAAAVFRTPHTKNADSRSQYRYQAPGGGTDINIEASAQSRYKQPLVVGVGLSYQFSYRLRLVSDLSFFNWSAYRISYFGQDVERDFKDIVKIGGGVEYLSSLDIFGRSIEVPFRVGTMYDPQPMKVPDSFYWHFSFGSGIHWGKFLLDIGASLGQENGSGDSLSVRRVRLSLGFLI